MQTDGLKYIKWLSSHRQAYGFSPRIYNKKDAIKYVETEIITDFLSMGYRVKIERTSKHSIVHMWNDEDIKYRRIVIWAIEKEKENTINKVKSKGV